MSSFGSFITSESVPELSLLVVGQLGQNRKSLLPAGVFKFSSIQLFSVSFTVFVVLCSCGAVRRPEAIFIVFALQSEEQGPDAESGAGNTNCVAVQIKHFFSCFELSSI